MKNLNFPVIDELARQNIPQAYRPAFPLSTRQWLLILLCSLIITASGLGLYHLAVHKHDVFGVVNLGEVYRDKEQEFTKVIAAPGVTDAERDKAIKSAQDFAVLLPQAMQSLSEECACIVLMGNAVGGTPKGVTDLTPALRKKVGL